MRVHRCTACAGGLALLVLFINAGAVHAQPEGDFAWSRQAEGDPQPFAPLVGPDGTIYTGNGDRLRAFTPDGQQSWSFFAGAQQGPIARGADGSIYAVGTGDRIVKLSSEGIFQWGFPAGGPIVGGPGVGPDGNIYAVGDAEDGGLGMFSLTPAGDLRWNEPGSPEIGDLQDLGHELAFSSNRVFAAMRPAEGGTAPTLWAFRFNGTQEYVLDSGCEGQPHVNPANGELVTANAFCQEVRTYDAETGALIWNEEPPSGSFCGGLSNLAIGPDGAIYTSFCFRAFWSLTAGGDLRWFMDEPSFFFQMDHLGVAPDNSVVLDLGFDFGEPGWVRAFSTDDGEFLWQLNLPEESQRAVSPPSFDASRQRAYFNAQRTGEAVSFLYAVDLDADPTMVEGDVDGDGVVGFTDLLTVINDWGPCPPPSAGCPADLDGDGVVGFTDLITMINDWGPCPPSPGGCPADLDGDGVVGFTDLITMINDWGPCPPPPPGDCPADLDGDGVVGFTDLLTVIDNWG